MKLLPESRQARLATGIIAVIVGTNLIAIGVDALVPSPEGPRSSSFATSAPGMAAWKELAERSGRDVRVVRERLSDASLPSEGTVVVLDPEDFTRSEARTLRRFAEGGGRVIAGALGPDSWIDVFGARLDWDNGGRQAARVLVPAPETGAAARVRTAGEGHWSAVSGALPIVAGADGLPIVVVRRVGRGRVALVADPSPLQNRLLDQADNAALALALAGDGPLVFLEEPHGYGEATGLAALPDRFQWALILLCLAAVVLIVARWPRLGPPDPEEEPLFPPRRAYVDALAATLAKAHERRAAVESVRSAARERLARRAALGRDADAERWHAAARSAGLSDEEARALQDVTDHDGIAAGRALAHLSGGERKRQ
jgi:Domain of unknown function (DUF4350)